MKSKLMMNIQSHSIIRGVINMILLWVFKDPGNISQDFTASCVVIFKLFGLEQIVGFLDEAHDFRVVVVCFVGLEGPSLLLDEFD